MGYTKAALRVKYIAIQASHKIIGKKPQIHKLTLHLKELEKEQHIKSKPNRREITKIRAEVNEIVTRRTVEQINETRSWFFERINKIDKLLASLIKKKR